ERSAGPFCVRSPLAGFFIARCRAGRAAEGVDQRQNALALLVPPASDVVTERVCQDPRADGHEPSVVEPLPGERLAQEGEAERAFRGREDQVVILEPAVVGPRPVAETGRGEPGSPLAGL